MTEASTVASFVGAVAWPVLAATFYIINRKSVTSLIQAAISRVQRGDEVVIGFVKIGQAVGPLQPPQSGKEITDDHLALIHRSWRDPKHDARFPGSRMYQIRVIVFGTEEALKRVDYVVYRLNKAYPKSVKLSDSLERNFELKELANGYSLIRAEVYVRDQEKAVRLSRFIDLTEASDRLSLPTYGQS